MITHRVASSSRAVDVAGVPFRSTTLDGAATWLLDEIERPRPVWKAVRLANAYCVALASKQPAYANLLRRDGMNFPDGAPVVAAMNALDRTRRSGRVRGPSFFQRVLELGLEHETRHFFLGTTDETLKALESAVRRKHPRIRIAGSYSPPFAEVDDAYLQAIVDRAASWEADIVWVGMGTPKQDFVAQALAERAGVFAVGVGAAFDFTAGTAREAPKWVQNIGFEWAFRLITEPRRLWHRYVFGNSRFLLLILQQWLRRDRTTRTPSTLAR